MSGHDYRESGSGFCGVCDDLPGEGEHSPAGVLVGEHHNLAHGFCVHGELRGDCDQLEAVDTRPSYVYVASSWRNPTQQAVVATLRAAGIDCYDFQHPPNGTGFGWQEVMPNFSVDRQEADIDDYLIALEHPRSREGFDADFAAMQRADAFVLVLPCGRSAHLELGWAVGAGKRTAILLDPHPAFRTVTPELMYRMVDYLAPSMFELLGWLGIP